MGAFTGCVPPGSSTFLGKDRMAIKPGSIIAAQHRGRAYRQAREGCDPHATAAAVGIFQEGSPKQCKSLLET